MNGSTDYVSIPSDLSNIISTNTTIEAWVNPCAVNGHRIIASKWWCNSNNNAYYFTIVDGKLRWVWDNDGCNNNSNFYESDNIIIQANIWQHVAVVHTSTGIDLYYNGVLVPGTLIGGAYGNMLNSNEPVRLGVYKTFSGSLFGLYQGYMDEARIWDYAASPADILLRYNGALTGTEPNLIGYYNMNVTGAGTGIVIPNTASGFTVGTDGTTTGTGSTPHFNNTLSLFDLGNDTTLCIGDSLLLDASIVSGTYLWQDNSTDSTFLVTSPGTYYIEINANCTIIYDTIIVDYQAIINLNLGNDTIMCDGNSLILDALTINGNYTWQDGSINSNYQVVQDGLYFVELIVNGCLSYDSILVDYVPEPILDLGNDTSLCVGNNLLLNPSIPNVTYLWQDNSTDSTFNIVQDGLFSVEISHYCGVYSDSILINALPSPILNLGNDTVLCIGDSIQLNAFNPGAIYSWNTGETTSDIWANQQNIYTVNANLNGCVASQVVSITYSTLNINFGADTTICNNEILNLIPNGFSNNHLWNDGSTFNFLEVTQDGLYWLNASDGVCSDSDSIYVTVDKPFANFDYNAPIACDEIEMIFEDNSSSNFGQIVLWTWQENGFQIGNGQTIETSFNKSGLHPITLTVMNDNNCFADTTIIVNVIIHPRPNAAFKLLNSNPEKNTLNEFYNYSSNSDTWEWHFGDGNISFDENPINTYTLSRQYEVKLIASNDYCEDSTIQFIEVKDPLIFYIPNVFTPNDIGNNNTFTPIFTSGIDPYDYQLTIFNRWGEIVFISYDPNAGWTGDYNEKRMSESVFIWQVEFNDSNSASMTIERGTVTLLK